MQVGFTVNSETVRVNLHYEDKGTSWYSWSCHTDTWTPGSALLALTMLQRIREVQTFPPPEVHLSHEASAGPTATEGVD